MKSVIQDTVWTSRRTPGVRVRYRIVGEGEKVLFLHGAWVDPFIFEELFTHLVPYYTLLIPDIPPFGNSSTSKSLSPTMYADLFSELLTALKWSDVRIVGHSYGGGIGLHIAAKSDAIRSVVALNPIGYPFRRPEILIKYPVMVCKALKNLAVHNHSGILKKILTDVRYVLLHHPIPPIATSIHRCFIEDSTPLRGIRVPVRVLWGKEDEMLPLTYIQNLGAVVPTMNITLVQGQHNWCLVDQVSAGRLILKYLRD